MENSLIKKRIKDIDEILEIIYDKKVFLEKKIVSAYDADMIYAIKNQIKELNNEIIFKEKEKIGLIGIYEFENEKAKAVVEVIENEIKENIEIKKIEEKNENSELIEILKQIRDGLQKKDSDYKDKLKATIPLIPGIIEYEFTTDVKLGDFFKRIWEKMRKIII